MGVDIYLHLFDAVEYRDCVQPQLTHFFASGRTDGLISLLQELIPTAVNDSLLCEPDSLQFSIDILNGDEFYGPFVDHVRPSPNAQTSREDLDTYVRYTVVGQLLQCSCIPKLSGHFLEQNMSRSELIPFLYEHSSWIEHAFTGGLLDTGERLEFPVGEHSEIVTRENVLQLKSELDRLPDPQSASVTAELSRLREILNRATQDSRFEVLLSIG
jgi:hypothetical protein